MPDIDLSLTSIFLHASGIARAVLVVLAASSVLCWTIILEKAVILIGLRRQAQTFEAVARSEATTADIDGLGRKILSSGREESFHRHAGESAADREDRFARAMRETATGELVNAQNRLSYLATIGSSAPFIGLFGTVWGIMHSFASIAQANDTSLAVVAPGIAEALSTTAIGLVAAIPASIAYNKLASDFGHLSLRFSLSIGRLARHLDDTQTRAAE